MTKHSKHVRDWRERFKARDPEGYRASRRAEWHRRKAKHPETIKREGRKANYKWSYGITIEEYDRRLKEQNGVCALCGKPPYENKPLSVEHNHKTGAIRGLVHNYPCNFVIYYTEEHADLCLAAQQYLEFWLLG